MKRRWREEGDGRSDMEKGEQEEIGDEVEKKGKGGGGGGGEGRLVLTWEHLETHLVLY